MSLQFNAPYMTIFDDDGLIVVGAKAYFYTTGGAFTTPKDVYSDAGLTTAVSQPVLSDAAGRLPRIFLDGQYDVVLKYPDGTTLKTIEGYDPGLSSALGTGVALGIDQGGTGATTASAALTALGAASQSQFNSLSGTVSDNNTAIATGVNEDGEFGALAALDSVSRDELATNFGAILLQRSALYTTLAASSVTSSIPVDSSKPQISEGTKIFDVPAFTPVSDTSTVRVIVRVYCSNSGSNNNVFAIFKDSDANAVAAAYHHAQSASDPRQLDVLYEFEPGATTPFTITVRAGTDGGTLTINGAQSLGGVMLSSVTIEEWEAH